MFVDSSMANCDRLLARICFGGGGGGRGGGSTLLVQNEITSPAEMSWRGGFNSSSGH